MKKVLLPLLCFAIILLTQRCTKKNAGLLNEGNLQSQFFTININKDTVIHTANGALINIPKGTLAADAPEVKIEVKEAFSIADMILGGLVTKAGNDPLSSGGMIYINPADNNAVTITKPIGISIPTAGLQDGMQLYKGERKSDGNIDWTNPQPLPEQQLSDSLTRGKELFATHCMSCHNPAKEATGAPLALLDKRRDWDWIEHFVANPSGMIAYGDPFSCFIFEEYNKTAMTAFPTLTGRDLHLIFDYVNSLVANVDPATIPDHKKKYDSCEFYYRMAYELEKKRRDLIKENGSRVEKGDSIPMSGPVTTADTTWKGASADDTTDISDPTNLIKPIDKNAEYYKITITQFGWYNIDILFKGLPGFENSELMVRLIGEYRTDITMYLVLPYQKILLDGGPMANKEDEYAFYTDDGKIPLPKNTKAYIIATGEHKGQLLFGMKELVTSLKQNPEMQLIVTTKEQMNIEIKKLNLEGLDITTALSKNADSLLKTDLQLAELKKYKPKDCKCFEAFYGQNVSPGADTASMQ